MIAINYTVSFTVADCTQERGRFQCYDRLCISIAQRCDRNPDCADSSDEFDCPPETGSIKTTFISYSV